MHTCFKRRYSVNRSSFCRAGSSLASRDDMATVLLEMMKTDMQSPRNAAMVVKIVSTNVSGLTSYSIRPLIMDAPHRNACEYRKGVSFVALSKDVGGCQLVTIPRRCSIAEKNHQTQPSQWHVHTRISSERSTRKTAGLNRLRSAGGETSV